MTSIYTSKIDWWLLAILIGVAVASVFSTLSLIRTAGGLATAALTLLLGAALPVWLLLDTRYELSAETLRVRSGPFRWTIAIADIRDVTPSNSPLSSPALSLDRLRISYGQGASLLISPADRQRFLEELAKLRSRPSA